VSILDQRFDSDGNWRISNFRLHKFFCPPSKFTFNTNIKTYSAVLNSYRKINKTNYIYNSSTYINQFIINTTLIANTDSWERNCQQAHTQSLEALFDDLKSDYALILEDDLWISEEVSKVEFINIINCAIESKINFIALVNNNSTQYRYGTVAYLVSRIFYYDVLRRSCFGVDSPIPIDMFT